MDDEDWNDDEAGDMDGAEVGEASENRIESEGDLLNLNNATKEDLMTVPGLGERTAEAIVKYREKHGRFENLQELSKIPELKKEHVQTLKKWVTI